MSYRQFGVWRVQRLPETTVRLAKRRGVMNNQAFPDYDCLVAQGGATNGKEAVVRKMFVADQ